MEPTDLAFVTKARLGDADAFRTLMERHSRLKTGAQDTIPPHNPWMVSGMPKSMWHWTRAPSLFLLAFFERPHLEHGQERFLRDLHAAHALHALLAFLLFLQQLALARDVAAVTLGQHVLADRADSLPRDHPATNRRLQG